MSAADESDTSQDAGRFGAGSGGLLTISDLFPAWQRQAACFGRGNERWFADGQGSQLRAARALCAGCPVIATCLDAALVHKEEYGIWGGCGEAERRTFARCRDARPHGPDAVDGCPCRWCAEWARHRKNLDAIRAGTRRAGDPGDRNGRNARHGIRASYARGCRCEAGGCRWSASKLAQVIARLGYATDIFWAEWSGVGDYEEARRPADAAAEEIVFAVLAGLFAAAGHPGMRPALVEARRVQLGQGPKSRRPPVAA